SVSNAVSRSNGSPPCGTRQQLPGVAAQWVNKNAFRRTGDLAVAIHAATSLCQAEVDPIGGAVTGSVKSGNIDECLQQQGLNLVMGPPIAGQLLDDTRQQMTSKIRNANPGQNQKPAMVDEPIQVCAANRIIPADPVIARGHLPGRTGKQQAGQTRMRWLR